MENIEGKSWEDQIAALERRVEELERRIAIRERDRANRFKDYNMPWPKPPLYPPHELGCQPPGYNPWEITYQQAHEKAMRET